MQRYGFDGIYSAVFGEMDNGQYVKHSDHEAAIAEARADERRKCVEELESVARDWKVVGQYGKSGAAEYLIEHLSKGITQ